MFNFSTAARRTAHAALCLSMMGAAMASHAASVNEVSNGSFEQPGQTGYCYTNAPGCQAAPWTGTFELIAANNGPWGNPSSRPNSALIDGAVVAGLQNGSNMAQNLTLAAGTHTLSWVDANRAGYDDLQTYRVSFGATTLGNFTSVIANGWTTHSVSFTTGASTDSLSFQGFGTGDRTAFIDNVQLTTAVPEPQSLALVFAGLAVVGSLARRRSV
jgi:hypothetical protein